uniref:Ras-related protein Rab-26 n=1 Tax=Cacopsylla melanoneura TaxID=428564 RepID=A0A8D8QPP0_9HEMI
MKQEDSFSDDVFESPEDKKASLNPRPGGTQPQTRSPSPTGYKDYKPPTFKIEEPGIAHKTILLGDSGVGKTSLLVQFKTREYQSGNFSATVGIGFTVSTATLHAVRYRVHGTYESMQ